MNNEQALHRTFWYRNAYRPTARRRPPEEKGRDPYDGLRPWSAITHGVGAVLAVIGTAALLAKSAALGLDGWHVVSFLIYGLSMIGLYTASTLYHCVNTSVKGRIALRKYDHSSIFLLIAGSYTPICLVALRTVGAWGWGILAVIWGLAILGITTSLLWINAPRWVTSIPCCRFCPWKAFCGCWRAESSIPWAACSMPSSGRAATIPASAAMRSSMCSLCWAVSATFSSCIM